MVPLLRRTFGAPVERLRDPVGVHYQHITRSFLNLNRHLNRLRDIDTDKQPELYRELASEILACTA